MSYDGSLKFDTKIDTKGFSAGTKAILGSTALIAGAFVGIGAQAVAVGMEFESQMSTVGAISNATAEDMQVLTNKAKELGIESVFSAKQAGEAFQYMAMAGWDTEQMLDGIGGVMDLAAASGEDLGLVSDIVTDSLTAFGLQASDTSRFVDILASASSSSNTNVAMLGESFKYVAPVAGAMGYAVEDVSVSLGLMANSGIKASQAGTSFRQILMGMQGGVELTGSQIGKLRVEMENSDGTMRAWNDVVLDLRDGFARLTDAEKASNAETIANKEGMSGLLAIVNASETDFNRLSESIENSAGTAAKMGAIKLDNLQGQVTLMKSSVEGLGIAFYDKMAEPLKEAVKSGVNSVNELTQSLSNGELSHSTDLLATNFANLVDGGIGLLVDITPHVINGVNGIIETVTTLSPLIVSVGVGFLVFKTVNGGIEKTRMAMVLLNSTTQANAVHLLATNGGLTVYQTILGLVTGKISTATVAQGLWNKVLNANPIGLTITAIAGVIGILGVFTYKMNETSRELEKKLEKVQDLTNAYETSKQSIDDNISSQMVEATQVKLLTEDLLKLDTMIKSETLSTKENTETKEELKYVTARLNELMPELQLATDNETGALLNQRDEVIKLTNSFYEMAKAKAMAGAYQSKIDESAKALVSVQQDLRKIPQLVPPPKVAIAITPGRKRQIDEFEGYQKLEKKLKADEEYLQKEMREFSKLYADEQKKINDLAPKPEPPPPPTGGKGAGKDKQKELEKQLKEEEKLKEQARDKEFKNLKYSLDMGEKTEDAYYKELAVLRDKYFEIGSDEWQNYTLDIAKYNVKLAEEQKKIEEEKVQEIVKSYTDLVDGVDKQLKDLEKRQQSYADKLSSVDFYEKDPNSEAIKLTDLSKETEKLQNFKDDLKKLEQLDIQPEFIEQIKSLGKDEGAKFADLLVNSSQSERDKFIEEYKKIVELSGDISGELHKDESMKLLDEITNIFASVPEEMRANGELSAEMWGEGFIAKTRELMATAKMQNMMVGINQQQTRELSSVGTGTNTSTSTTKTINNNTVQTVRIVADKSGIFDIVQDEASRRGKKL